MEIVKNTTFDIGKKVCKILLFNQIKLKICYRYIFVLYEYILKCIICKILFLHDSWKIVGKNSHIGNLFGKSVNIV